MATSHLIVAFASVLALDSLVACSATSSEDPSSAVEALAIRPPTVPTSLPVRPVSTGGGGFAPVVSAPTSFVAWGASGNWGSTAGPSVLVQWNETASPVNPQTFVIRQQYDIYGNLAATTTIKTFSSLPAGPVSFTDEAASTADHSAPLPDTQVCYYVLEEWGGSCSANPNGVSCIASPTSCVVTKGLHPSDAERVQLEIVTSTATQAAAPADHVQVSLAPLNSTWIDSTQVDFASGSDITYDLDLGYISDRSDITGLTIQTDDDDGLCINQVKLYVDGTLTFAKSYGSDGVACQWVWESNTSGGSLLSIPFVELRSSATWQSFNPPNLVPGQSSPFPFVGYDANALIVHLDSIMGNVLRDPAQGLGDGARLSDLQPTTTTLGSDSTNLYVVQNIVGLSAPAGTVDAAVSYQIVIHTDAATCGSSAACIKIENISVDSDYSGLLDLGGIILQAFADDAIQATVAGTGTVSLPSLPSEVVHMCFVGQYLGAAAGAPIAAGFGPRSLTICAGAP